MSPDGSSPRFEDLLANNRAWVESQLADDPDFFRRLSSGQEPPFLVVACSDSRVSLNAMLGTRPGQVFIHRNVANQILPDDPNVQAVLEFGIHQLGVRHIVVMGHTHCGGVAAALEGYTSGALGAWLKGLREVRAAHDRDLLAIGYPRERANHLTRVNVITQVENLLRSPTYREALSRGKAPELHGWVFEVETGYVREVELSLEKWKKEGLL